MNNCKECYLISENKECYSEGTVCKEHNKRFTVARKSDKLEKICKIKIDGCVFAKTDKPEKCDYLFIRCKTKDFYFVELKGKDYEHAYNQIIATINSIKKKTNIQQNQIYGFMITTGLPSCANQKFLRLKERFENKDRIGNKLIKATNDYQHII